MFNYTPKSASLSEIDQTVPIRFSFVQKKGLDLIPVTPECKCRDYFSDLIVANLKKDPNYHISIYGFNYTYTPESAIDTDHLSLVVCFPEESHFNTFYSNLNLLNKIEKDNGFEPTEIIRITGTKYYFRADKVWQQTTYLISLYTYLIRWFCIKANLKEDCFKELSEINSSNVDIQCLKCELAVSNGKKIRYWTFLREFIKKIPVWKIDNFEGTDNISAIHNYGGIRNLPIASYAKYSSSIPFLKKHKELFGEFINEMSKL